MSESTVLRAQRTRSDAEHLHDEAMRALGRRRDGSEFPIEVSLGPFPFEATTYVMAAVRERRSTNGHH